MSDSPQTRIPLSLRLPAHVVEVVDSYARTNRISKTDAFLHFLQKGMESERGELHLEQFSDIKRQLAEIKSLLSAEQDAQLTESEAVREAVAIAAQEFSAIERAYLFGSFARGTFNAESDIDVRIECDSTMSFNLHDLAQFQKRIEHATGRAVDVISARHLKNKKLAAAIEKDKELVYERKTQ